MNECKRQKSFSNSLIKGQREQNRLAVSDNFETRKRNLTQTIKLEKENKLFPSNQKNKTIEINSPNRDIMNISNNEKNKTFHIINRSDNKHNSKKVNPMTKYEDFRKGSYNCSFQINNKKDEIHLLQSLEKNKKKTKIKANYDIINDNTFNDDLLYNEGLGCSKKNIGFFTKKGRISDTIDKQNNQDSYLYIDNLMNLNDCCLLGIMDGHGTNGHFVSQYIKEQAKEFFQNKENYFRNKNEEISLENIQNRLQSKNFSLIRKFYKKTNNELPDTKFDTHFSGSTCNLVFKLGQTIICSNTGDSRSIIIKENKNKQNENKTKNNNNNNNNIYSKKINDIFSKYEVEELSIDHKPENKEEKERILEKGGIVSQSENGKLDDGPYRVWVKGENYPGISMSRSLGDEVAESVGVISDPDFIVKNINDNYKYIVSGSDGLFEFMKNEDIMDIINPFFFVGDVEGACKELGKRAAEEWNKLTEERDDITFIILFIGNVHVKKETI
jgi:serine/threonine protein phosphatase PrpC